MSFKRFFPFFFGKSYKPNMLQVISGLDCIHSSLLRESQHIWNLEMTSQGHKQVSNLLGDIDKSIKRTGYSTPDFFWSTTACKNVKAANLRYHCFPSACGFSERSCSKQQISPRKLYQCKHTHTKNKKSFSIESFVILLSTRPRTLVLIQTYSESVNWCGLGGESPERAQSVRVSISDQQ